MFVKRELLFYHVSPWLVLHLHQVPFGASGLPVLQISRVPCSTPAIRYLSAKLSACDAVRGNIFNINCFPLMAQRYPRE